MKKNETGIFQKENGNWYYRFTIMKDGKKHEYKRNTDENGCKLTSQKAAIKAKEVAMKKAREELERIKKPLSRKTFSEVYAEYVERGRNGKAYQTIRKQDSLWDNHIKERFGARFVDEVSVAEINDYLTDLYYVDGYAYKYVESFLKMFYLIFGQAYSRDYLDVDIYNKLCLNKGTKICMPKLKIDEDLDIVSFNMEELTALDAYFKGTNAETAYMLGRYCGLRINECFGLKWENVDIESGTILIDRQMQYQDGVIKLVPLKTRNAKRTIIMCDKLKVYLQESHTRRQVDKIEKAEIREQKKTMLKDIDGEIITSLDLVNALPDGKIQTVNSMKYHTRMIKEQLGIDFKFHYLRHTYGTFMADMNTPAHLLCKQMGHGSIQVTQKYYIAFSDEGINVLKKNLNQL